MSRKSYVIVAEYSNGSISVGETSYHNEIMKENSLIGVMVLRTLLVEVTDVDLFLDQIEDGTISVNNLLDLLDKCVTTYHCN